MRGVLGGRRRLVGETWFPLRDGAAGMDAGRGGRVRVRALAVLGRGVVAPADPVLHADDEARLRGRAAFETVRVYGGVPFRLDDHLGRLAASGGRLAIPPVEPAELRAVAAAALAQAAEPDAVLRLYLTPGREGEGRPTALALVSDLPAGLE